MKTSTKLLAILSANFLVSCGSPQMPPRPKGTVAAVNAHSGYMLEFDFDDFDEDLKTKSTGTRIPLHGIADLHKHWCMDAPSKEALQAYIMKWKARVIEMKKENDQLKQECR